MRRKEKTRKQQWQWSRWCINIEKLVSVKPFRLLYSIRLSFIFSCLQAVIFRYRLKPFQQMKGQVWILPEESVKKREREKQKINKTEKRENKMNVRGKLKIQSNRPNICGYIFCQPLVFDKISFLLSSNLSL